MPRSAGLSAYNESFTVLRTRLKAPSRVLFPSVVIDYLAGGGAGAEEQQLVWQNMSKCKLSIRLLTGGEAAGHVCSKNEILF